MRQEGVHGREHDDERAHEAEAVVGLADARADAAHVALGVDDARVRADADNGEEEAEEEQDKVGAGREVASLGGDGGADDEDGCAVAECVSRRLQRASLSKGGNALMKKVCGWVGGGFNTSQQRGDFRELHRPLCAASSRTTFGQVSWAPMVGERCPRGRARETHVPRPGKDVLNHDVAELLRPRRASLDDVGRQTEADDAEGPCEGEDAAAREAGRQVGHECQPGVPRRPESAQQGRPRDVAEEYCTHGRNARDCTQGSVERGRGQRNVDDGLGTTDEEAGSWGERVDEDAQAWLLVGRESEAMDGRVRRA